MRVLLLVAAAGLLFAGCGSDDSATPPTDTNEPPAETTTVGVYFLLDGKVWPVAREVEETTAVATAALDALVAGPTAEEADQLGFETAVPGGTEVGSVTVDDGVAEVELSSELTEEALAQVVYTLTRFETVETVEIGSSTYARADFEDWTPAILVESPLAFQDVESPLRVTGTANTFEATFQYELTDTDGRIVDEGFVTATSGSGERGTFDFTTAEYEIPFDGVGALIVFELSAKDGSRTNLVEIPLRMSR